MENIYFTIENMPASLREHVVVVLSAGNSGLNLTSEMNFLRAFTPNAIKHVILVGGTEADGKTRSGSFNSSDIPTDQILAQAENVSATVNGVPCTSDGTSFAAPQVSRLAAQLNKKFPGHSSAEIVQAIRAAALLQNGYSLIPTLGRASAVLNGQDVVATVTVTSLGVPVGGTRQASATLRDTQGNVLTGGTVTWESVAPSLATVSATGLVTGVKAGVGILTATSQGIRGSATVTITANAFLMAIEPPTLTLAQGVSGTAILTVFRASSFTDAIALTASAPSGITISFSPSNVTGTTSAITITASKSIAPGTYTLFFNGNAPGQNGIATFPVKVVAAPGFALETSPASLSVAPGANGSFSISITRTGGFTGPVNLSATTPAGISVAFSPATLSGATTTSVATVSVASGTPAGALQVTIRGNATDQSEQTATLGLTVSAPGAAVKATNITYAPTPACVLSSPGSFGGYCTSRVTVDISGEPSGTTIYLLSVPSTGTASATVPSNGTNTLVFDLRIPFFFTQCPNPPRQTELQVRDQVLPAAPIAVAAVSIQPFCQ